MKSPHDIIIRPVCKVQKLIVDRVPCCHHDHRCIGFFADLLKDLTAIHTRQHDIQQDQIHFMHMVIKHRQPFQSVQCPQHTVSVQLQIFCKCPG